MRYRIESSPEGHFVIDSDTPFSRGVYFGTREQAEKFQENEELIAIQEREIKFRALFEQLTEYGTKKDILDRIQYWYGTEDDE